MIWKTFKALGRSVRDGIESVGLLVRVSWKLGKIYTAERNNVTLCAQTGYIEDKQISAVLN